MIYGNKARNIGESVCFENEIFDISDKDFLVENMAYAILNDDMSLLEYCSEFSSTQVLQESVKDVINKVIDFIKGIIGKIKELVGKAILKIQSLFSKLSFKTDKDGKLKKQSNGSAEEKSTTESYYFTEAAEKYESLYDLAGVELSKPVVTSIGDMDSLLSNKNWFQRIYDHCKKIISAINRELLDLNTLKTGDYKRLFNNQWSYASVGQIKSNIESYKGQLKEELSGDLKQNATYDAKHKKEYVKLTKDQIDAIIKNSEIDEKTIEKYLNENYKETQKSIEDLEKILEPWRAEDDGEVVAKVDEKDFESLKQYTANVISEACSLLNENYSTSVSEMMKCLNAYISSRRQLEAELVRLNNEAA